MIRKLRPFLSYAPVALAILARGIASAADGSSHETKPRAAILLQQSALTVTTSDEPSVPVDSRPKPPQAAFDACKSASEGDACSVSFDGHTMSGTCRKGPNGEPELVCVPAHPPGPPPEAVEACKGSAEGATCSMTMPDGKTLSGTCRKDPGDSDVVACAPPHPDGPPPSGSSTDASSSNSSRQNSVISSSSLEHQLDQLERESNGN